MALPLSAPGPLAVRSSAVDEDGADASFAGQHLTLLNVRSADDMSSAVNQVWWSANSDSAITYRQRIGTFTRPSVGVVVQKLLDPVAAGVMFTRNPVTGDDERVIETTPGYKKIAVRGVPGGGTVEEKLAKDLVEALCLDDGHLQALNELASRCERVYGPGRDIEWALADGTIDLLQCRAITKGGK